MNESATARLPLRRILLVGLGRGGVDARIFKGFNQYRHGARNWILKDLGHTNEKLPAMLTQPRPFEGIDGVMGHLLDPGLCGALREAGLPAVDVSGSPGARPFPQIRADGAGIGRMAADHFQGRHYASYLYVSNEARHFEVERWEGFAGGVRGKNRRPVWCVRQTSSLSAGLLRRHPEITGDSLESLLGELEKPLAVLAATDYSGIEVCDLVRGLGMGVPEDVAVLGVDDFDLLCESCYPPLSSVSFPAERMGFEAARVLDQLMRGEAREVPERFPPTHVHTRASTELTAVEDSAVARAVSYIRDHMREGMRLADIAAHVHMHERTLLRHFRKAIGRSPTQELQRVRLERARNLLLSGDAPLYEISDRCGFSSPDMLTRHFKAETGVNPREFREMHRVS